MKRAALLLLTAIYLLSCLGITANSYYCCGILQATTIFAAPKHKADCEKMASTMPGCCKTKKQYFKVKDQHFGASAVSLNIKIFPAFVIPSLTGHSSLKTFHQEIIAFNIHAPPDLRQSPVYMLNCAYLI